MGGSSSPAMSAMFQGGQGPNVNSLPQMLNQYFARMGQQANPNGSSFQQPAPYLPVGTPQGAVPPVAPQQPPMLPLRPLGYGGR